MVLQRGKVEYFVGEGRMSARREKHIAGILSDVEATECTL